MSAQAKQKAAPGNTLVPFGKYRGQPVEVLNNDPDYVEWLRGQSWFAKRIRAKFGEDFSQALGRALMERAANG